MNRIFLMLVLSLLSGFSYGAACEFNSGYGTNTSVVNLASTVNLRGDTPPHTLLWSSGWMNGGNTSILCATMNGSYTPYFDTSVGYSTSMTLSSIGDNIYDSGIPGIGVKVYYSNSHDTSSGGVVLTWPRKIETETVALGGSNYYPASEYKVEFWSTGVYSSGHTTFPNPIASIKYDSLLTNQATFSNTNFVVNLIGCDVPSTVNVALGDIGGSIFTNVGVTSDFKNFTIPLNCHAGTKIYTTIDATKDSSNVAGVIQLLSQANSATGLGVQLYYSGGSAVTFGTKTLFKTSSSTTESINLAARLYQTQKNVTLGKVSAVAYLTMTYE